MRNPKQTYDNTPNPHTNSLSRRTGELAQAMKTWTHTLATENVCPLWTWGDFVISGRPNCFTLSLRPPGEHIPCGQFPSLETAQRHAESIDLMATAYTGKITLL